MAITGGYSCITRASDWIPQAVYTLIVSNSGMTAAGTITNICVYNSYSQSFNIKCKIFRVNGTDYDVVHTHSSWQTHDGSGAKNFAVSWDVQSGDLVGFSVSNDNINYAGVKQSATGTAGRRREKSGDVTTTTAIADWSSEETRFTSVYASGETSTGDKYVDITTGSDSDSGDTWSSAYLTVKKGIDNLPANDNLHIAEGDYSAQAAIDLNQNMNLICEDYGGGNANPPLTVTLPVTA